MGRHRAETDRKQPGGNSRSNHLQSHGIFRRPQATGEMIVANHRMACGTKPHSATGPMRCCNALPCDAPTAPALRCLFVRLAGLAVPSSHCRFFFSLSASRSSFFSCIFLSRPFPLSHIFPFLPPFSLPLFSSPILPATVGPSLTPKSVQLSAYTTPGFVVARQHASLAHTFTHLPHPRRHPHHVVAHPSISCRKSHHFAIPSSGQLPSRSPAAPRCLTSSSPTDLSVFPSLH